jgi:putative ABC transport system permease protein
MRYAFRMTRKAPGFAAAAMVTIALGIGASTAMFSVTDAVLLRPLPYKNQGRLVLTDTVLSNADFWDLRNGTKAAFEDMSAIMVYRAIVPREDGSAERVSKGQVTTNFFGMMGAKIAFGRDFTDADGKPPARMEPLFPPPEGAVAILSYPYFQRRYGGNTAVLGHEMLSSGGHGPTIVGVLAPGFELFRPATTGGSPDIWIANNRGYDAPNRDELMLQVVGAMRDGVALEQAQAHVDSVVSQWRIPRFRVGLKPWHKALAAEVRPALVALMGSVIFLLLIACANVANLLLVRASMRGRELGIRAALGAGWQRIARQLLAEALLLVGFGTLMGVGLAWAGVRTLLVFAPSNVPRLESVRIDWRVLAFAALAGLLESAILAAILAWRAARPDVMDALRHGGHAGGLATGRVLRDAVVVAEVALSFVLLIGSGLMFRSFLELRRVNPGYDPHGLLTFLLVGDARGFQQPERRLAFLGELEDRLRAIPGVENVGASLALPLAGRPLMSGLQWGSEEARANPAWRADLSTVLPGYFETLRTPLVEGRTFTGNDNAPGRNVAVVDEFLAAKAFPHQSAIGKRVFVNLPDPVWLEVIGVVEHQRQASLANAGREQIYLTDGFFGIGISRHWALRTAGDPTKYGAAVRAEVAKFAPGRLAVTEMQTMDTTVDRAESATRFQFLLMGVFAAIAALLAAVGLYGVLSSVVRQRMPEIGVRMALGAAPSGIFKMVVGRGLLLSAVGVAGGFLAAVVLTRAMTSMLVGVTAADPATFMAMIALFFAIAAVASWAPARRAAALDPNTTLRLE